MASPPSSQQAQVSGIARILKRPDSNTAVLVQHFHLHLRHRAPIWPLAPTAALAGEQRTQLQHIPQHHNPARSHPVQRRSSAYQLDSQRSDRPPTSTLASLLQQTPTTSAQQQQRIFQRRVSIASAPRQHRISTASLQRQHRASTFRRRSISTAPAQLSERQQLSAASAQRPRSISAHRRSIGAASALTSAGTHAQQQLSSPASSRSDSAGIAHATHPQQPSAGAASASAERRRGL
jgi:hypothetical protein